MEITFLKAAKLDENEIESFKKILIQANEVNPIFFDGLISLNPKLILVRKEMKLIGIGALKKPNESYKNRVFKSSETVDKPDDFSEELGWIVSLEKGIGNVLVKNLASEKSNMYATVRSDNEKMKHLLIKYGFETTGKKYKSTRNDNELNLFVKRNTDL